MKHPHKNKLAISSIPKAFANDYRNATKGIQNVGANIRSNVAAGQKAFQAGTQGYRAINPLSGSGKAFASAFKKKARRK